MKSLGSWTTWWYIVFVNTTRYLGGGPNEPCFNHIGHLAPISRGTIPGLAEEVVPLLETYQRFVAVLDLVKVECFLVRRGTVRGGPRRIAGRWPGSSSPRSCGTCRRRVI